MTFPKKKQKKNNKVSHFDPKKCTLRIEDAKLISKFEIPDQMEDIRTSAAPIFRKFFAISSSSLFCVLYVSILLF